MDKKIDNLYRNDKTDEAIHQLIKKIDEHPKNVDNYLQLSTYLIEQGVLIKLKNSWSKLNI